MTDARTHLGSCLITQDESQAFARLSGDFNPLHLDPVTARRYQFGSTLIHGINGTLRALDIFFATRQRAILTSLQVTFTKPVRQGDELSLIVEQKSPSIVRIEVHNAEKKAQAIEFSFAEDSDHDSPLHSVVTRASDHLSEPGHIDLEQADGLEGNTALWFAPEPFKKLFPNLAERLPDSQSASILASSEIVGMICPGLNSVYARLNLQFTPGFSDPISDLYYRVKSVDPRFSRVVMDVRNAGAEGEIEAFFRPAPVVQASLADIGSLLTEDRFSGQHALVVGGSRGLGEVTAKLLSAGGATTLITYAKGREDAARVADEISASGASCQIANLDVLDSETSRQLVAETDGISHIYYMASPLIEKSIATIWDSELFSKYSDFYIAGLADLLAQFAGNPNYRKARLNVYLPSTVFIDQPEKGFFEYAACKAAAEALAFQVQSKFPNWSFLTPRLPRMLTDQTSGIAGLDVLDSARQLLASLTASDHG